MTELFHPIGANNITRLPTNPQINNNINVGENQPINGGQQGEQLNVQAGERTEASKCF